MQPASPRRHSPAAERNRDPILAVLREVFPATGTVLEIAAGSGQHAVHFARALPGLTWWATDPSPEARASIADWAAEAALPNLRGPLALDVCAADWPEVPRLLDAALCCNMVHIAPWEATLGLFAGLGPRVRPGGVVALYGPFQRDGGHTAPSNAAFDADLKSRDPRWGVRALEDVTRVAESHGFVQTRVVEMPANNLTVVFVRG